jgi:hypothetical protein
MSALGQKPTRAPQKGMSALPQKAAFAARINCQLAANSSQSGSLFIEELADHFHRRVRLLFHDPVP